MSDLLTKSDLAFELAAPGRSANTELASPPRRHLVMLFALVVATRLLFSIRRTSVVLTPDELANLGAARFLAGEKWLMFGGNTYQPGLPTLLAPIYWVVQDPTSRFRAALVVGALFGGVASLLMVPLVLRLTLFGRTAALVVAGGIALLPASLGASDHVWAEPLVTVAFLATVLGALRFSDNPRLGSGLATCAAAIGGYLCHGRLLPLALVSTVLVVGLLLMRREIRSAAIVGGSAVAMLVAVRMYARWMIDEAWLNDSSANSSVGVLRRLRKPHELLDAAAGQAWYLLGASLFIGGFGLVELIRRAAGRDGGGRARLAGDARIVLLLFSPLVATSVAFMSDRPRPDHLIYGRYTDAVLWPVLAVGLAWIVHGWEADSARTRRWICGGLLVAFVELGLFLHFFHSRQFAEDRAVMEMIPGLDLYIEGGRVHPLIPTLAVSLLVGVVVWWRSTSVSERVQLSVLSTVSGLFLVVSGVNLYLGYSDGVNEYASGVSFAELTDGALAGVTEIGVALVPDDVAPALSFHEQNTLAMVYQWSTSGISFKLDGGLRDDVGPFVLAPTNDIPLAFNGGSVVWADPQHDLALWLEPSEEDLGPEGSDRYPFEIRVTPPVGD